MNQKQTIEELRHAMRKLESRPALTREREVVPIYPKEIASWFPFGGFARGALTEIRSSLGEGGSSLVAPALASESQKNWVAFVDCSGGFNALGLNEFQLEWSHVCVVRLHENRKLNWAIQQLSRSGLFSLVVVWRGDFRVDSRMGRTVLQAAEAGNTAVVFVGSRNPLVAYPCTVRVGLESLDDGDRELSVLKGDGRVGDVKRIKMGAVWGEINASSAFSSLLFGCRP